MRVPLQPPRAFVPLTDDEVMQLFEQGLAHLLRPYRVGVSCEHRGTAPEPLPDGALTVSPESWPEVA